MQKKTIILGGGITGLVTAYHARNKNHDVCLYEASNRLGGMIQTHRSDFGIYESAANGFILTDDTKDLLQSLQLEFIKTKKESKRRFFFKNESAQQIPVSFFCLLKSILRLYFKDSLPNVDENFYHWSCRIFGKETTLRIVEPAIGGIYAADLISLDPRMVFSDLNWSDSMSLFQRFKKKRNKKRTYGLVSFKSGMNTLIEALESSLHTSIKFYLKSKSPTVSELCKKYDTPEIHVCFSLGECFQYLKKNGFNPPKINLLNISTVTCFYKERLLKKSGFGLLFPRNEGIEANGVLFNSDIFESRTVDPSIHSETWIYSGNKLAKISDERIRDIQYQDRKKIIGKDFTPLQCFVTNWKDNFPIYDSNLMHFNEYLDELESTWKKKGINVIFKGNYRRGIGLRSLFEMASR